MTSKVRQQRSQGGILSRLNVVINTLNLAEDISGITPAQTFLGPVSTSLTMVGVGSLLFCGGEVLIGSRLSSISCTAE